MLRPMRFRFTASLSPHVAQYQAALVRPGLAGARISYERYWSITDDSRSESREPCDDQTKLHLFFWRSVTFTPAIFFISEKEYYGLSNDRSSADCSLGIDSRMMIRNRNVPPPAASHRCAPVAAARTALRLDLPGYGEVGEIEGVGAATLSTGSPGLDDGDPVSPATSGRRAPVSGCARDRPRQMACGVSILPESG